MKPFVEKAVELKTKREELTKLQRELTFKEGQFNQEFSEWMTAWSGYGEKDNFAVIDLITKVIDTVTTLPS